MKKYNKEEKAMWLDDWRQSGKNAWTYAKEKGLVPQTFVTWTKPGKENTKQELVEVPKKVLQSSLQMHEILIQKGDIRVHIPLEPVLGELQTVIASLGQAQ